MSAKVLDSRDLAERQEELRSLRSSLEDAREERKTIGSNPATTAEEREAADAAVEDAEAEFGEDEAKELAELDELESEISEWTDGAALIRCDYWVDYVRELLSDIGVLPKDLPHYIVIDWDATADNIKADYTEVTFDGDSYYVRNC